MTARTPVRSTAEHEWMRTNSPRAKTHVVDQSSEWRLDPLCSGPVGRCQKVDGPTDEFPRCEGCVWALAFPSPFYVYTLHGAGDEPIYIDCTSRLYNRMFGHRAQPYWADVTRATLVGFDDMHAASRAELAAIKKHMPRVNRSVYHPYAPWATSMRVGPVMTHSVTVMCNRCDASTPAEWAPGAKKLFPVEDGWSYIGRGINLCPSCTAGLNAWLERRPQPPAGERCPRCGDTKHLTYQGVCDPCTVDLEAEAAQGAEVAS